MESQYQNEVSTSHSYQELLDYHKINNQLIDLSKAVEDGHIDALEAFAALNIIEKLSKSIKDEIKEIAVQEAELYAEKTFSKNGFQFTKIEGKATYSFKHIEDWVKLDKQKKALEQASKDALRMAQSGKRMITEDGEEIETAIVKHSEPTLSVKLNV